MNEPMWIDGRWSSKTPVGSEFPCFVRERRYQEASHDGLPPTYHQNVTPVFGCPAGDLFPALVYNYGIAPVPPRPAPGMDGDPVFGALVKVSWFQRHDTGRSLMIRTWPARMFEFLPVNKVGRVVRPGPLPRGLAVDCIERVATRAERLFIDSAELCMWRGPARDAKPDQNWSWKTLECSVPFVTETGWRIVVFQDGETFDYIEAVKAPNGSRIEYRSDGTGLGDIGSFGGIRDLEDRFIDEIEVARIPRPGEVMA